MSSLKILEFLGQMWEWAYQFGYTFLFEPLFYHTFLPFSQKNSKFFKKFEILLLLLASFKVKLYIITFRFWKQNEFQSKAMAFYHCFLMMFFNVLLSIFQILVNLWNLNKWIDWARKWNLRFCGALPCQAWISHFFFDEKD